MAAHERERLVSSGRRQRYHARAIDVDEALIDESDKLPTGIAVQLVEQNVGVYRTPVLFGAAKGQQYHFETLGTWSATGMPTTK
jgi:hypothetical protein